MRNLIILIFLFPVSVFASFPVISDVQFNDTIIENGKIYKEVAVDSLYKYPLKNESMQDYRKRLKSKGFVNGVKAESIRASRTPLTFWQVIGILAIIWLVAMILYLSAVMGEFN